MSEKTRKTPRTISRREFLKDAGIIVGSTAISSAFFLSACGEEVEVTKTVTTMAPGNTVTTTAPGATSTVTTTAAGSIQTITKYICPGCNQEFDTLAGLKVHFDAKHSRVFPASQGYLVVDSMHCTGCQNCMMACSMVHEGEINLSHSRIQILHDAFDTWPADIMIKQCRQCVNPLCVQVCPSEACHIDTEHGNVRVVDETKCLGQACMRCIKACPFLPHRNIFNREKNFSMKCDLCINTPFWSETGGPNGKQACVEVCPVKALKFVTEEPLQTGDSGYDFDQSEEK
jgi:protein NrfC